MRHKCLPLKSLLIFCTAKGGKEACWVGATDTREEWVWRDQDDVGAPFQLWVPGQPDHASRSGRCASLVKSAHHQARYRWHDFEYSLKLPVFCQKRCLSIVVNIGLN